MTPLMTPTVPRPGITDPTDRLLPPPCYELLRTLKGGGYRLNGEQRTTAEYCERLGLLRMKPKGRGGTLKLAKLGRGWPPTGGTSRHSRDTSNRTSDPKTAVSGVNEGKSRIPHSR